MKAFELELRPDDGGPSLGEGIVGIRSVRRLFTRRYTELGVPGDASLSSPVNVTAIKPHLGLMRNSNTQLIQSATSPRTLTFKGLEKNI